MFSTFKKNINRATSNAAFGTSMTKGFAFFVVLISMLSISTPSFGAVAVSDVQVIDPTDEVSNLLFIDARDPNDGFVPSYGIVRVTFQDDATCDSALISNYYLTTTARAQDETEYVLYDFKRHGESGDYDATKTLGVTCSGGVYTADYQFNPTETQALGFYDFETYIFDTTEGAGSGVIHSYSNNLDIVEFTSNGIGGFPVNAPILDPSGVAISVSPVDIVGAPGTSTNLTINFDDDDFHLANTFDITITVRHPDNKTETVIVSGPDGTTATRAGDSGTVTVNGVAAPTYSIAFNWNPEDDVFYPQGKYDIEIYVKDEDGLSSTSTYSVPANDGKLELTGGAAVTTVPPNTPGLTSNSPVVPGGTETVVITWLDDDKPLPGNLSMALYFRNQDTDYIYGPFVPSIVTGGGGSSFTGTYNWDTTGALDGWYDIYFEVIDDNLEGMILPYEDYLEEFYIGSTVDITSVTVSDFNVDIQPDEIDPMLWPINTTITVNFNDSNSGAAGDYTVTIIARHPDNSTETVLVDAKKTGEDGLTVAGSGTGPYTATFTWTPLAGSDEGLYDLFVSINDGAVGNTDESDYVENLDIISLIDDPTLPPPPYELNEAPTVGPVGLTNSCIGGGCSGFEVASISFDFYDFEDEGVSSYLVSVSLRGIDGVTIYDLITDGDNTLIGSGLCAYDDLTCTLSIVSNGDGNYTGTLSWNAEDATFTGLEGYYDVQVVVKDGVGAGGESSYDINDDVLNISNSTAPPPATDPPIITGLSVVTTNTNNWEIQLETAETADFTATFTDGDNPTDTSKYTLVYKVRATGGTEVSVTCAANVTNLGSNSFSDTCTGWLPSGTINTGFYDLQVAITDNNGTPGDVTDDVTSVYGFDSNQNELNVLTAANLAPNAPSAIDHVDGADVTLGAVTAYTTGSTVKFQATMTDQNALDDVWLEVEVEEIATAYNDTNGSDNVNIFCFPDFPHFYEEPTAVDGEIDCTITADGEYKWQYRVKDGGGLSTAWTSFGNPAFIRDTVAPTADAPTATPISGAFVAGTFDVTATLTDATAGIGSCELTINNGGIWSAGTVGGSKPTFTCSQTAKTCTNGASVDIAAKVSDLAGNGPTVSSTTTYTCDSAAPTYTWVTPATGTDYKDTSVIPVDVTIADVGGVGLTNGEPCNAKIDGALTGFTGTVTYNAGSCTGNLTINVSSGFSEGDHGITIQVADKLGTSAVSVTRTVTIDNTPPVTTLAGNSGGNWSINDHSSIVLSPTDGGSGVASTEYCVDTSLNTCVPNSTGDQFGTGTAISVTCVPGSACYQYIRYRSIDNSANAETVKSSISLIDKQLPTDNGANLTITNSAPDCKLDWTAATDGHSGMVGGSAAYKISRTTVPAPAPGVNCTADVVDTISSALITYTDTTTVIPNLYNYRICAVDAIGNVSAGLAGSQQCNTGDTTAPTVASGPTLDATTSDPGGPGNPYVAGSSGFNYTTVFTEAESSLSSCEYTIDGSTWSAGVVTGPVGNDYTCTASAVTCPTHDALLTINMKGTSSGGSVTATAITTYMCDNVVPNPDDTINTAWVQSTSEAVAITEIDVGSGILGGNAWTKYCYNGTDDCTPGTLLSGGTFDITCSAGSTCENFVKYQSSDRAGNLSSVISSANGPVRQDNEGPLLTLGTTAHSPTQCQYNFTVADDASGTVGIGMSSSAPSEIKIARSVGGSAPANCNSPYDTIAGNLIIYTDTTVDPETVYSYRFCASDLLGNTNSAYDAIGDTGTTNECSTVSADTTAPTMNTVSVASVSPRSVTLSWTAPGDDDDGTDTTGNPVKFYDVKYLEAVDDATTITGLSSAAFWGHADIIEAAKEPQPTTPGSLQIAPIACQLGANNWSCPISGQDTLLRPNSLYYFAVKATDDEDTPNVSAMSNITDGTVDLVGSHTALKYGWNIVSVPHNVNVGTTKLEDLFGDDLVANANVYAYAWDGVASKFVDLDETAALNTQIGQGQGFYLYSFWTDKAIDQHLNAGGSLDDNGTNWVQISPKYFDDSQNTIELIGNPYNVNVNFNDIEVCSGSTFSDSTGCVSGTQKSFGAAADAGWLNSLIISYPNSSTPLPESCVGTTTSTCAPVMRPWWGYEVEILSGGATADIFFSVPAP